MGSSRQVIDLFDQRKYHGAAQALLQMYEASPQSSTNIWSKMQRPVLVQRLGYEMAQDADMRHRLQAVQEHVFSKERTHLLWYVPELFERDLPPEQQERYRLLLSQVYKVFMTDSLEGVIEKIDEGHAMGVKT